MAETRVIATNLGAVAAVCPMGAYRRITVAGADLLGAPSIGPDEFMYLLLPPPGRRRLTVGHDFTWAAVPKMARDDRPVGAYYTVAERRPDLGEVDLDVFLHEGAGPAASWALGASVGDEVALWGPRTAWDPPPSTRRWLLVADETGVPALVQILAALASMGVAVDDVAAVVPHGVDHPSLGAALERCRTRIWDRRHSVLSHLAAELPAEGDDLYVWTGAERALVAAVRDLARSTAMLTNDQLSLTAYWSRSPRRR